MPKYDPEIVFCSRSCARKGTVAITSREMTPNQIRAQAAAARGAALALKDTIYINNGKETRRIKKGEKVPSGFTLGRYAREVAA